MNAQVMGIPEGTELDQSLQYAVLTTRSAHNTFSNKGDTPTPTGTDVGASLLDVSTSAHAHHRTTGGDL
jgi:hypothetical protein